MKTGEALIHAAKKQAEGEVAVHIANIKVYQTIFSKTMKLKQLQ